MIYDYEVGCNDELMNLYPDASLRWVDSIARTEILDFQILRFKRNEAVRVHDNGETYFHFTGNLTDKMVMVRAGDLRIVLSEDDYGISKQEDIDAVLQYKAKDNDT